MKTGAQGAPGTEPQGSCSLRACRDWGVGRPGGKGGGVLSKRASHFPGAQPGRGEMEPLVGLWTAGRCPAHLRPAISAVCQRDRHF